MRWWVVIATEHSGCLAVQLKYDSCLLWLSCACNYRPIFANTQQWWPCGRSCARVDWFRRFWTNIESGLVAKAPEYKFNNRSKYRSLTYITVLLFVFHCLAWWWIIMDHYIRVSYVSSRLIILSSCNTRIRCLDKSLATYWLTKLSGE